MRISPPCARSRWIHAEAHASGDADLWLSGTDESAEGPPVAHGGATRLLAAQPNPAARAVDARIEFTLAHESPVVLRVHDVRGALVARLIEGSAPAGRSAAAWDGRDVHGRSVPAGVYFVVLEAGGVRDRMRIVRLP